MKNEQLINSKEIDYFDLYKSVNLMINCVKDYAVENNLVNASYHLSINWLNTLLEKSYKNIDVRMAFWNWLGREQFKSKRTNQLKKLLEYVNYHDDLIVEYNAFDLLDSVHNKLIHFRFTFNNIIHNLNKKGAKNGKKLH